MWIIRSPQLVENPSTMLIFIISLYCVGVLGKKYVLPGICPDISVDQKLNYNKFTGLWYQIGGYVSGGEGIHDCGIFDIQKTKAGYTLKETFVDGDEANRTQFMYEVALQPIFEAEDIAQFITSHNHEGHLIQRPLTILSTDYKNYAIVYICQWLKNEKLHYVVTWLLSRNNEMYPGDIYMKVGDELSKYPELVEYKEGFSFKPFNNFTCDFNQKLETDFLTSQIF